MALNQWYDLEFVVAMAAHCAQIVCVRFGWSASLDSTCGASSCVVFFLFDLEPMVAMVTPIAPMFCVCGLVGPLRSTAFAEPRVLVSEWRACLWLRRCMQDSVAKEFAEKLDELRLERLMVATHISCLAGVIAMLFVTAIGVH